MPERDDAPDHPLALRVVDLASGRRLEVEPAGESDLIRIRGRDGACVLSVELTDAGPVLRFEGAALELVAPRRLDIQCGALRIDAAETAEISARAVEIEARRGGVAIRANDDVRVNGERVLLNSTEPPIPLTWDEYLSRQQGRALLPEPPPDASPREREEPQRDS